GGLSAFTPAGFAGGFNQGMQNFQHQQSAELAAKRLEQEANFHADSEKHKQFEEQSAPITRDANGKMVVNPVWQAQKEAEANIAGKFAPAGNLIKQNGDIVPIGFNQRTGQFIDGRTGQPMQYEQGDRMVPNKQVPVSPTDAKNVAEYFVKTGDMSR